MKNKLLKRKFECEREGLILRGTEYRLNSPNQPIAIVSHGFMAFQATVKHYAKQLARLGYAAYCFDFAGGSLIHGKSDGKTEEMSVLTECKDLETVLNYVKGLEYTNSNDILLMGCSQGGFVSSLVAAKLKQEITKLVLFYPALCIPDDARSGRMMFAKFEPNNLNDIIWCGPMKLGKIYVQDVLNMDPYKEIKDYPNDVMIVHGTKDGIVNIEYAKKAIDTYLKANPNRKVIYHEIVDGKHVFNKRHDKIAIKHLIDFSKIKD